MRALPVQTRPTESASFESHTFTFLTQHINKQNTQNYSYSCVDTTMEPLHCADSLSELSLYTLSHPLSS